MKYRVGVRREGNEEKRERVGDPVRLAYSANGHSVIAESSILFVLVIGISKAAHLDHRHEVVIGVAGLERPDEQM